MCLTHGHKAVMPVRLEPTAPQSQAKHSPPEPLRTQKQHGTRSEQESDLGLSCLSTRLIDISEDEKADICCD